MNNLKSALWIGMLLAMPLATANATPVRISTLYNTGVDSHGVPLPNNTLNDPHYSISAAPRGSSAFTVIYRNDGVNTTYPIGPWTGNDNLSAWIAPRNFPLHNPAPDSNPIGSYYYTTRFNLTGYDLSTVRIWGAWSGDDIGAQILLNGISMRILTSLTLGPQNFAEQNTFNWYYNNPSGGVSVVYNDPIQAGFVQGVNSLTFRVDNYGGATGFRVEMNAFAELLPQTLGAQLSADLALPEPVSAGLLGIALAGVLAWRRRPVA